MSLVDHARNFILASGGEKRWSARSHSLVLCFSTRPTLRAKWGLPIAPLGVWGCQGIGLPSPTVAPGIGSLASSS